MKRHIFPLLLFVLLLAVNKTNAQQATTITGSFKAPVASPAYRLIDVNYTMTISPGKDKVSIETKSSEAAFINMDILGSDNKVLSHWTPQPSNNCSHSFDISGLSKGSYHLNVNNNLSQAGNNNGVTAKSSQANNVKSQTKSFHDVVFTK